MMNTRYITMSCLLSVSLLLTGCVTGLCSDTVRSTALSPAGRTEAKLFERNCGATEAYNAQVSLARRGWWLSGKETVFVIKGSYNSSDIKLQWTSENKLRIVCPDCLAQNIYREQTNWHGVNIDYDLHK